MSNDNAQPPASRAVVLPGEAPRSRALVVLPPALVAVGLLAPSVHAGGCNAAGCGEHIATGRAAGPYPSAMLLATETAARRI